jgi:hypothetical protein
VANLTITDGLASYPPAHVHCGECEYGGGIYNAGTLTLDQSAVTANVSRGATGGIYNSGPRAVLTLKDTTVSGNSGFYQGGGITNGLGTVTLEGSTVSENRTDQAGGGISSNGYVTVKDSTITDNRGESSGGIYNSGIMKLHHSTVSGNIPDNCEPLGSIAGCIG